MTGFRNLRDKLQLSTWLQLILSLRRQAIGRQLWVPRLLVPQHFHNLGFFFFLKKVLFLPPSLMPQNKIPELSKTPHFGVLATNNLLREEETLGYSTLTGLL